MPGAAPCLACSRRWHGFVVLGTGGCEWCLANRRVSMPMVEAEHAGESRGGQGAGDHDVAYEFGNPRAGLTLLAQARLTVMRGYMLDVSHAPDSIRGDLRYGNDDDYICVIVRPSGIAVPLASFPDDA